ncbi:patatin-like phospholipase family protein [Spirosoma arcticum]
MNRPNRSLRLCEILEEEYDHLHQSTIGADPPEQRVIDTIDLLNKAELATGLAQWLYLKPGAEAKNPSPVEVRYKKLADWILAYNQGAGSPPQDELLPLVKTVLENKLASGLDLMIQETWLQDASLRPYTRGLLKCYYEQGTVSSRIRSSQVGGMFRRSFKLDQAPEPVDQKLLNRLLLEDAFTGYIHRMDDKRLAAVFEKMHESRQTALCLSGGGIRSATFALGIVQGLVKHDALDKFTYLSTVSGGGYLGGWLSAWIHHEGFGEVNRKILGQLGTPLEPEAVPAPVQQLLKPPAGFVFGGHLDVVGNVHA